MTKSIYDQLNAYGTVAKQRFVETFSGDALDTDRWNTVDVNGTNTFAMSDSIDGGFKITTGATVGNMGMLSFNNIRPFSNTGAVCIMVVQSNYVNMYNDFGLSDNQIADNGDSTFMRFSDQYSTKINFVTANAAGSTTDVATSVALTTAWTTIKVENKTTSAEGSINGVLEVTNDSTTNRPTNRQQPIFKLNNAAVASAKSAQIRYVECYNT